MVADVTYTVSDQVHYAKISILIKSESALKSFWSFELLEIEAIEIIGILSKICFGFNTSLGMQTA